MTYFEAERYYIFYVEGENEKIEAMFRLFAFHNLESTRIANCTDKGAFKKYVNSLRKGPKAKKSLEEEFDGVNFE